MNTTLFYAGIACVIAAIAGGGLKAFGLEIPALNSITRQLLLAGFGAILALVAAFPLLNLSGEKHTALTSTPTPSQTPTSTPAAIIAHTEPSPTPQRSQPLVPTPTPTPSKPKVFVYYANDNQARRVDSDIKRILPANGFDVVEARHPSDSEVPPRLRPEYTEVIKFGVRQIDTENANKLCTILFNEFKNRKLDKCNVVQTDLNAVGLTHNRQQGEFVIWFDNVVASPIATHRRN